MPFQLSSGGGSKWKWTKCAYADIDVLLTKGSWLGTATMQQKNIQSNTKAFIIMSLASMHVLKLKYI